jgi:SNF2 family DNA or RNA helicase
MPSTRAKALVSKKQKESEGSESEASRKSLDPFDFSEHDDFDEEEEEETEDDEDEEQMKENVNSRKKSRNGSKTQSHTKQPNLGKECEEADQIRLNSLARHRTILEPFISEKMMHKLEQVVTEKKCGRFSNTDTTNRFAQPPTITNCTLRDYQLEGFNWLLQQYDLRINSILGDEMGLGSKLIKLRIK